MGSDHHLLVIAPIPLLAVPTSLSWFLRRTPAELSLERVRSVSVVGLHDVSVLFMARFLFSRPILLFVCLSRGLFYSPCLDYTVFGYFTLPATVGTELKSPCLRPRRVSPEPTRLSLP